MAREDLREEVSRGMRYGINHLEKQWSREVWQGQRSWGASQGAKVGEGGRGQDQGSDGDAVAILRALGFSRDEREALGRF